MKIVEIIHYEIYVRHVNPTYTTRPYPIPDYLSMNKPLRNGDMFELETIEGDYIYLMADKVESIKCMPKYKEPTE